MKLYQSIRALFLLSALFFEHAYGSNLNGTVSVVYKNQHHVFSNGESALGYVRMNGGFTVKPGATATLDTVVSVSGSIDLRETGVLQLLKDLNLDAGVTWSSGGYIKGRGRALILGGNLTLPSFPVKRVLHIIDDTIIDGKGNTLFFEPLAEIFVDNNITLTLRNLTLRNKITGTPSPSLKIGGNRGRIALDNVHIAMSGDFPFTQGQLYFHNDVIFTGTSTFSYTSPVASFVAPGSRVLFDHGTSFSFAPTTTTDGLFILQDRTSTLHLNGCTLMTTISGMRLTKGNLLLDNKVVLKSNTGTLFTALSPLTSQDFGIVINALGWSSDGRFLAIGGNTPGAVGGFGTTDLLRVYSFSNSVLGPIVGSDAGAFIRSLAWSPDGQFIAIGINTPGMVGGFANNDELRIYSFNRAAGSLTAVTSRDYGPPGCAVRNISWSPDGKFLAIAGIFPSAVGGFANTDEFRVYGFDGTTLTPVDSKDFGNPVNAVSWSPDGKIVAIGGDTPAGAVGGFANTDAIRLYSFNGSTLTALTSQPYGGNIREEALTWSPDGTKLAVGGSTPTAGGGFANTDELRIYHFNGSTLSAVTSQDYGTVIYSIRWSPDGKTISIGGNSPVSGGGFANTDEFRVYKFDGQILTALTSKDYGSEIRTAAWHPYDGIIAIGGDTPGAVGGFANTDELRLYNMSSLTNETSPQAYSRSIVFGNSNLGSSSNLNVEILGAAHVTVNGIVNDDSV